MKYLERLKKANTPTLPTDKTDKSPSVSNVSTKGSHILNSQNDFVPFCLDHENTYPDGHCPIKRDKCDPLTDCLGWKMKTGKYKLN